MLTPRLWVMQAWPSAVPRCLQGGVGDTVRSRHRLLQSPEALTLVPDPVPVPPAPWLHRRWMHGNAEGALPQHWQQWLAEVRPVPLRRTAAGSRGSVCVQWHQHRCNVCMLQHGHDMGAALPAKVLPCASPRLGRQGTRRRRVRSSCVRATEPCRANGCSSSTAPCNRERGERLRAAGGGRALTSCWRGPRKPPVHTRAGCRAAAGAPAAAAATCCGARKRGWW